MSDLIYNTAREQAEAEVAAEKRKEDVSKLKDLFRKRDSAKTILENIEREIEDLSEAIEQGNG